MRFELRETMDGGKRLTVEFSRDDLVRVPLDQIDKAMLSEPARTVADHLLDAELIARRLEQIPAETA